MYFPAYNPTLHDPYLYDSGNTGYPIGINPNCLLYDARESYKAISLRYRDWDRPNTSPGLGTPPPGSTASIYPNYYNNNYPLYFKLSDKFLSCSTHFTYFFHWDYGNGNYFCTDPFKINPIQICTSDSSPLDGFREGGLTGLTEVVFWNSGLTGINFISDTEHMYDYISTIPTGGATFGLYDTTQGATFYKITGTDHAIIKKKNYSSSNNFGPHRLSAIHLLSILSEEQFKNIKNYITPTGAYVIPVTDVYLWGGNDTICPVNYISFSIPPVTKSTNFSTFLPAIKTIEAIFLGNLWGGDSSGLILYKKNGKLYSLGHILNVGSTIVDGTYYGTASGPTHASTFYPSMKYFIDIVGITAGFYFSNKTSKKVARTWHFDNVKNTIENIKNKLESII